MVTHISEGWAAIVAAEAGFFHVLLRFWAPESFPQAATSKSRAYIFDLIIDYVESK